MSAVQDWLGSFAKQCQQGMMGAVPDLEAAEASLMEVIDAKPAPTEMASFREAADQTMRDIGD